MKKALCAVVGFVCLAGSVRAQTAEDFFRAIRGGDLETLRKLSVNPNVKDRLDTTPLHYAAIYGNPEAVRILLEHGAPPNPRQEGGWTPLHEAAQIGDVEMVKILLEHGARVNDQDIDGRTALDHAMDHLGSGVIQLLVKAGADTSLKLSPTAKP